MHICILFPPAGLTYYLSIFWCHTSPLISSLSYARFHKEKKKCCHSSLSLSFFSRPIVFLNKSIPILLNHRHCYYSYVYIISVVPVRSIRSRVRLLRRLCEKKTLKKKERLQFLLKLVRGETCLEIELVRN